VPVFERCLDIRFVCALVKLKLRWMMSIAGITVDGNGFFTNFVITTYTAK
jgi:hypothetical protein